LCSTIALLCLLSLAAPCSAHAVACQYDLATQQWTWETAGAHPLTDWLSIGYSLRCLCEWKAGIVPSWVRVRQDYTIWAEARQGAWSVRLTDWCNHWLSQ